MHDYTVLIVDDEVNVLKSLRRLFLETGYKVLTAGSGTEGLKTLEQEHIHLVISDYRMPEMNGVELLARVKREYPETIRMILSGFADVSAIVEAINDGEIYKFLAKPWNDQELLSTVKRALEHSSLQRENLALLHELQSANMELKKLATGLESKVKQRTRDLEHKSRAVNIAHNLLNMLPVGVLGVDSDEMIVYMNRMLGHYMDVTALALGVDAGDLLDPKVVDLIRTTIATGRPTVGDIDVQMALRMICSPLQSGAGVVAVIGHFDADSYRREFGNTAVPAEAENE